MLSHRNLMSNVIAASERFTFDGSDIALSVLPLSHVFERTGMYIYILNGMAVYYAESIEKVPETSRRFAQRSLSACRGFLRKSMRRLASPHCNQAQFASVSLIGRLQSRNNMLSQSSSRIIFRRNYASSIISPISWCTRSSGTSLAATSDFVSPAVAALPDEIWLIFTGAESKSCKVTASPKRRLLSPLTTRKRLG